MRIDVKTTPPWGRRVSVAVRGRGGDVPGARLFTSRVSAGSSLSSVLSTCSSSPAFVPLVLIADGSFCNQARTEILQVQSRFSLRWRPLAPFLLKHPIRGLFPPPGKSPRRRRKNSAGKNRQVRFSFFLPLAFSPPEGRTRPPSPDNCCATTCSPHVSRSVWFLAWVRPGYGVDYAENRLLQTLLAHVRCLLLRESRRETADLAGEERPPPDTPVLPILVSCPNSYLSFFSSSATASCLVGRESFSLAPGGFRSGWKPRSRSHVGGAAAGAARRWPVREFGGLRRLRRDRSHWAIRKSKFLTPPGPLPHFFLILFLHLFWDYRIIASDLSLIENELRRTSEGEAKLIKMVFWSAK